LIVQHVVAASNLAVAAILNVNPLTRIAGFTEKLQRKRMAVDFLFGQFGTGEFAESGENVREIGEVFAGP